MATTPQRYKERLFKNLSWCLGGENVLPKNVLDPPLEDTKITTKGLSFFRDEARKKSPLRGSRRAVYLVTQSIGVRFRVSGRRIAKSSYETTPKWHGLAARHTRRANYSDQRLRLYETSWSDDCRLTNCGCRSPRRRRYSPYEPEALLCSF